MLTSEQEALKVKQYYSYQKNRTDGNVLEQLFYFLWQRHCKLQKMKYERVKVKNTV